VLTESLLESTNAIHLARIHVLYTCSTTEKRARTSGPTLVGLLLAAFREFRNEDGKRFRVDSEHRSGLMMNADSGALR
jgi:hypothetical protein